MFVVDQPANSDRSSWSDAALCAEVIDLALAAERAEAELAAATAVWHARQAWAVDGAASGPAWLAEHTPMTRAAAARLCRTARLVADHEQTAKALDVGDVTVAHVEVLAGAVRRREGLYPEHEDTLLRAAASLTPDDLVTVAKRWRSLADDQLAAVDAAAAHEQWLDAPERAGRASFTLNFVVDVDTLLRKASLDACDARCDLDNFGPVGRAIAERVACDAKVARIVMAGRSKVLDLGRSTRIVSPALRQAVMLRDRHCQIRGCRVPAKWCDVHHIVHWLDGGETNLDNLVLLCRRHHVDHHEGGWTINRQPDGTITTERTTPHRHPRRRRRRREQSGEPNLG